MRRAMRAALLPLLLASCVAISIVAAAPLTPDSLMAALRDIATPGSIVTAGFSPLRPSDPAPGVRPDVAGSFTATIQAALGVVAASQQNVTTPFLPPFSMAKESGLFPSFIHFNMVGGPVDAALRNLLAIWDNNGFVTNWVLQMQLEAMRLGAVKLDDEELFPGLNATIGFKEQDDPADVGTMDFWKEINVNGTWQQYPVNVAGPIELAQPVAKLLQKWCDSTPSVCPLVEPFVTWAEGLTDYLAAFGIPADFDDSGVNLALGGLLQSLQVAVPQSHSLWSQAPWNASPAGLMDRYVRYAYRPFSPDWNQNTIDPRTYYWIRPFLAQHKKRAEERGEAPDLMLIVTWVDDIAGSNANFNTQHKMPFLINNIDGSVVANSLFGLVSSILAHAAADGSGDYRSFVTADVRQLLRDSGDLMAWIVESEILTERNDLVLLYYPPVKDFFYFASRTVRALQSVDVAALFNATYNDADTAATLAGVRDALTQALRGQGTTTLLAEAQRGPVTSAQPNVTGAWWDEFLGNGDLDQKNQTAPSYDDRLFTTAIATNALLATWTTQDERSGAVAWAAGTPLPVKQTVAAACAFLNAELVSGTYRAENAFFSGSVKGDTTLPYFYPINSFRFANGTLLPRASATWDLMQDDLGVGFSGVVDEQEYQAMMATNPLEVPTPTSFGGYNVDGVGMVFWSAPPLTFAAGALALAQCAALGTDAPRATVSDSLHSALFAGAVAEE